MISMTEDMLSDSGRPSAEEPSTRETGKHTSSCIEYSASSAPDRLVGFDGQVWFWFGTFS